MLMAMIHCILDDDEGSVLGVPQSITVDYTDAGGAAQDTLTLSGFQNDRPRYHLKPDIIEVLIMEYDGTDWKFTVATYDTWYKTSTENLPDKTGWGTSSTHTHDPITVSY